MAKSKGKAANLDEKYTGAEPSWADVDSLSQQERDQRMRQSLFYYNYYFTVKDLRKDVVRWLQVQKNVSKELITAYMKSADHHTGITAAALARCFHKGMPFTERHSRYLMNVIQSAARTVNISDQEEEKTVVKKPSVQDHLRAQADFHIVHFEELEAQLMDGVDKVQPQAMAYLREKQVPQPLISKIRVVFQQRRDELVEARAGTCAQLTEGYRNFKSRDFKRFLDFYEGILADLDAYGKVKRETRKPRAKKPVDRARLVKKLNYLKSFPELKLTSISPQEIIGSEVLWVYNTKNRKLGRYVAEQSNTLGVRGSTILGYDPVKSVSKTLRKPQEQLAELAKASKVAMRKFMENIRSVEVELNGRINKHMILIRAH